MNPLGRSLSQGDTLGLRPRYDSGESNAAATLRHASFLGGYFVAELPVPPFDNKRTCGRYDSKTIAPLSDHVMLSEAKVTSPYG